ncbi:hypothetical protein D3C79_944470 [compost metagenome]
MVELHAGLHDDADNALHRRIQPQSVKCLLVGFQCADGILHPGDVHAVDAAGFPARDRYFGANHIGQRRFLRISGGLFRGLT